MQNVSMEKSFGIHHVMCPACSFLFLSFSCHCRTTSVGKLRHFSALTGMLRRSFAVLVGDDS
jgi:hypothetical protein